MIVRGVSEEPKNGEKKIHFFFRSVSFHFIFCLVVFTLFNILHTSTSRSPTQVADQHIFVPGGIQRPCGYVTQRLSYVTNYFWPCPKYGYVDLLPPPPSELLPFSWKMRTVLDRMKNKFLRDIFFWVMVDFVFIQLWLTVNRRLADFCEPDSDANQWG